MQNLHRYALYIAFIFLCFLWYDAIRAFRYEGRFYVGLGTVIMLANVVLLSLYTFSCHSLRHLIGGKLDCFSCAAAGGARHSTWKLSSFLNEHHMLFAWASLISVGLADFYIRLVASGAIQDLKIL